MTTIRKYPPLKIETILAWMEPNKMYTSTEIADAFGIKSGRGRHRQELYELLVRMARAKHIERCPLVDRTTAWAKIVKRAPIVLNTSIAGPQVAPDLRSTLHGYEAEIRRRVDLCMATRGR